MTEPRTVAGRALLADTEYQDDGEWLVFCYNVTLPERILAIEAEARAEAHRWCVPHDHVDPDADPAASDTVEVRKDSGGVFPDGTTNHPPIDYAATPPASETVEAAWESLADDPNMPYGYGIADTIAAHRPHIEAAIRAESGDLDDHERVRIFNESYAKGRRDALDEARAAVERERGESRRQVRAAYDLALAAIDALREQR